MPGNFWQRGHQHGVEGALRGSGPAAVAALLGDRADPRQLLEANLVLQVQQQQRAAAAERQVGCRHHPLQRRIRGRLRHGVRRQFGCEFGQHFGGRHQTRGEQCLERGFLQSAYAPLQRRRERGLGRHRRRLAGAGRQQHGVGVVHTELRIGPGRDLRAQPLCQHQRQLRVQRRARDRCLALSQLLVPGLVRSTAVVGDLGQHQPHATTFARARLVARGGREPVHQDREVAAGIAPAPGQRVACLQLFELQHQRRRSFVATGRPGRERLAAGDARGAVAIGDAVTGVVDDDLRPRSAQRRRDALHDAVLERGPDGQRLEFSQQWLWRPSRRQVSDALAQRAAPHRGAIRLRRVRRQRVEAQLRQPRGQQVEQTARSIGLPVLQQPAHDQQGGFLGHSDAVAAGLQSLLQLVQAGRRQVVGVDLGAATTRGAECGEQRAFVVEQRPAGRQRAGREATAHDFRRRPHRHAGDRLP